MREFIYSLFIHGLCFQILFGKPVLELSENHKRYPASSHDEVEINIFKGNLEDFRSQILGSEKLDSECAGSDANSSQSTDLNNEEELLLQALLGQDSVVYSREEQAFNKYVDSLESNACGVVETLEVSKDSEECKSEKILGYIDIKANEIMKAEADSVEDSKREDFSLENEDVRKFHKEALVFKQRIREYLVDESLSKDERVELLAQYLGSVVLPMRDLVTVLRAYSPSEYKGSYFYESLLPQFSGDLIEDEVSRDLIESGPNKLVENFYLKIEEKNWGKVGLKFNSNDVIARDITALLRVPTAKNYVRASKWMTLQMMLTQVATYDAMLGLEEPIAIPNSCQNHLNGDLPAEVKMQYNAQQGNGLLNRILAEHGLIYSQGNTDYSEFYLDLEDKDPLEESYSGLMPFESYKAAMQEVYHSEGKSHLDLLNANLDDYQNFEEVVEILRPQAIDVFFDDHSLLFGLIDSEDEVYKGTKLFNSILSRPDTFEIYEYEDSEGSIQEVNHISQNLSTFLTELMQRHKVGHWEDLVTGSLKEKLTQTKIKIKFPSLYGATAWRMWSLKQLEDFANNLDSKDIKILSSLFNRAYGHTKHPLNKSYETKSRINDLKKYLNDLKVSDEFIPTRRLNTEVHRKGHFLLGRLWNELLNISSYLPKAKISEFSYIKRQMENGNPWARLRLSYLILMNELEYIKNDEMPIFSKIPAAEFESFKVNSCIKEDVGSLKGHIEKAAYKMGLNNPLEPGYANLFVNDIDKKIIFNNVIEKGSSLFKQKNTSGKPFYQDLEEVTYSTMLTREDVEKFVNEKIPSGLQNIAWSGIDDFLETDEANVGRFITDLYKLKGQPDKQLEYFEQYSQDFGIDNTYDVKRIFLIMDNNIKIHVLKSLLRNSANLRKTKIMKEMETLCNLESTDQDQFKTLFYLTSKSQNQLNQLTGAPTIPNEVMEKINEKLSQMSGEEKKDMWLGIGAGMLGVGAMLIGGACTGLSGGICAPLGLTMMAAGASAMSMQTKLVTREYGRKQESNINEKKVKAFEELGFANLNASSNVSRGWFWTTFEAASIIPLVGIAVRSIGIGTKVGYVFAENSLKSGLRAGFKATAKSSGSIYSETDVALSRLVLGMDNLGAEAKEIIKNLGKKSANLKNILMNKGNKKLDLKFISKAIKRIRNLHKLYGQGKISLLSMTRKIGKITLGVKGVATKYTSKVVVKETTQTIDKQTAKTVADYFGGNPKGFHYLMKTYASKVPRATRAMRKYDKGTSLVGKASILPWIRNGIRSLRYSHLSRYSKEIMRLEREAAELVAKNGNLEEFILKNVDELTDIFKDIPVRKRELPYMFFIQGGPHLGKSLSSISSRAVNEATYWASNGLVMRKFFNARSRLIYEGAKLEARSVLGASKYVAAETALESFRLFQQSVSTVVTKTSGKSTRDLIDQYSSLEDVITKEVLSVIKKRVSGTQVLSKLKARLSGSRGRLLSEASELDEDAVRHVIFSPRTEQEKALGTILWSALPVDRIFNLQEMGDIAHRVVRELSNYENVGEYEKLLNAFRVLIIKRDAGVVEIM